MIVHVVHCIRALFLREGKHSTYGFILTPVRMGVDYGESGTSGCILKQRKALNTTNLHWHPGMYIHFGDLFVHLLMPAHALS